MASNFELKKSTDDRFHFNLKAGNGEIILSSQMYSGRDGAENGIESVRANAADDARYERLVGSNDQPYFVLKAANGQVIGRSEMYSSPGAMENGIESVKRNAPEAGFKDLTIQG